jgi:hypothetical protein
MPATKKTALKPGAAASVRARAEEDARRLDHISASLEAAQKDLTGIGGSLGTGVRDLRRDVSRLLRDARRDLLKMRRAVQRDMERLQHDLTAAATAKPPRRAHAAPRKPSRPAGRHPVVTAH